MPVIVKRFLLGLMLTVALLISLSYPTQTSPALAASLNTVQANDNTADSNRQLLSGGKEFIGELKTEAEDDSSKTANSDESLVDTVVDKLNLKEPLPTSTKKFFNQIKGDEPISNDTHPYDNQ